MAYVKITSMLDAEMKRQDARREADIRALIEAVDAEVLPLIEKVEQLQRRVSQLEEGDHHPK